MKTVGGRLYLSSSKILLLSVFSFSPVIHGAAFNNHTLYNNTFQRGLSCRGNDKVINDYIIPESHEHTSFKNSKLFPLFAVIKFANEICTTTSEETGICYTRKECAAFGGLEQGSCASGIGVCCRFKATCGAIISQNTTTFQNPNYPSKYSPPGGSEVCEVRIRKQPNVCQLKLNFIAFDVEGPAAPVSTGNGQTPMPSNDAGVCKTDSLAITSSSGVTVPSLCGNMNGQHIYVEFGSSDTITLNLLLGSGNNQMERTWNIEILTIPCNSISRAPSGCVQYFTGVSGQVESFNLQGGVHLANLDYSVCVRMEDGMRYIDWIPCSPDAIRFAGDTPPVNLPIRNEPCIIAGFPQTSFPDYLIIPSGISFPYQASTSSTGQGQVSNGDRFCDASFYVAGSYVRSYAKPFFMHIKTDMAEGGTHDMTSEGFCFRWQQNPQ